MPVISVSSTAIPVWSVLKMHLKIWNGSYSLLFFIFYFIIYIIY